MLEQYLPAKSGLFRAYYVSTPSEEYYLYSPAKKDETLIRVTIRTHKQLNQTTASIFESVKLGYLSGINWVLSRQPRIDLNVLDDEGYSPLMWAVWLHQNPIAERLVRSGADVNMASTKSSPIFSAIGAGNLDGVKLLLSAKTNVNFRNSVGKTPIMEAVLSCNYEIVQLLVQNGASLVEVDNQGRTIREYSCDDKRILSLLR